MLDALDCFSLALAVLNHEENAHKVLADLLEESGDRGLAQWARSRKGKRRKRLDFVMALLPPRTAVLLACDYADEMFSSLRRFRGGQVVDYLRSRLLANEAAMEDWSEQEWFAGLRPFRELAREIDWNWWQCLLQLAEAAKCALQADDHERHGDAKESHKSAEQARLEARRIANAAWHNDRDRRIDRQIEHTKRILTKLLEQSGKGKIVTWPK